MSYQDFSRRHPFDQSLWQATGGRPPAGTPLLDGDRVDVTIVGAGIVGAVLALRLQRAGVRVAVVDGAIPGSGATGRSGGFVVPSFSAVAPETLRRESGGRGEALLSAVAGSADLLFDLLDRNGIDSGGGQNGWYQPAHSDEALARAAADLAVWQSVGARMTLLDAEETGRATGVDGYRGSVRVDSGGTINPVRVVHGLLEAAVAHGAQLHTDCLALDAERRSDGWHLNTAHGVLLSDRLLVCTNARSRALGADIDRSVVPLRVCQLATKPIAEEERASALGQGQGLGDTRLNLFTYRFDEHWRLITGAMPAFPVRDRFRIGRAVARRFCRFLPLSRVPEVEYVWFGQASVTRDRLPAIYEIGEDGWAITACNGRGLALSAMIASRMADALLADDLSQLPVSPVCAQPIAMRPFQILGARLYSLYGRARDVLGV